MVKNGRNGFTLAVITLPTMAESSLGKMCPDKPNKLIPCNKRQKLLIKLLANKVCGRLV